MVNRLSKVSVIIPAYNEEDCIKDTICELQKSPFLEIILVDNGSTDSTPKIATSLGVKVISLPQGTIAAVRNFGVKHSAGDILVFVDSDVRVTEEWHKAMEPTISELESNPNTVTGSRYRATGSNSYINRYWYAQLTGYRALYINSGNLVTSRKLFECIGGFSENLITAEDYDFCQKARRAGAAVYDNPELVAIHDGYPQTIFGFVNRERWLGYQDVTSLHAFMSSKIAWLAFLNLVGLFVALGFTISGYIFALPAYFVCSYLVLVAISGYKFRPRKIDRFLVIPIFFYFYLCGRSLSILDKLMGRASKRY